MAESELARHKASKSKRTLAKSACTRAKTFIDEIGGRDVSVIELRQRQAKFRECWKQFEDAQYEIEQLEENDDQPDEIERQIFEEKYFGVDARFEELIAIRAAPGHVDGAPGGGEAAHRNNDDDPQPRNVNIRLPRIDLPSFSGSYENWRPFHEIFNSMIHQNNDLPTIQKMHYLKAALKDEAADVISSLELSAENYVEAWEMLTERYDNQRVIVQKHIKAIFEQPNMAKENHVELRHLLDAVLKHLRALKVLKRDTEHWDDLIIHIVTSKLATATNKEWETSLKTSNVPTLKELTDFLSHRCRALEAIDRKPQNTSSSTGDKTANKKTTFANVVTDKTACSICKGDHPIYRCKRFLDLSVDQRFQEVKTLHLCLNCLKSTDHRSKQCNSGSCKKCNKKHNTLLHMEARQQQKNSESKPADSSSLEDAGSSAQLAATTANFAVKPKGRHVLLSTAIVHVRDVKGNVHSCRALLDNGSQSNFVTGELASRLGLRQHPTCVPINGVGNSKAETRSSVKVSLQSRFNGFKTELNCLILRNITQDLPAVSINRSEIRIPPGIKLADPDFMESSRIDMLVGVETFWDVACVGQIKATESQPYWQKTQLGWIAAGGLVAKAPRAEPTICNLSTNEVLKDAIVRFWEIEHGARKNELSLDERKSERYFESTVRRNSEGRFIVKLPIKKEEMSRLGQSKETAIRRFKNLEKRLDRQPALKRKYSEFLREYEALGHMRETSDDDTTTWPHYYLPHHCVIKEDNSTTKLRVVFDASCKTMSGISLNNALVVGPVLQQDLFSIIARFRTFKFVLVADIAKMYRQVLVDESQVALQRIIWREQSTDPLKEFELLTVTYGTGPASFLAIKALRRLAEIEAKNFPIGSLIAQRDFYVDDLITGSNSKAEALKICEETTKMLEKGLPEASTTNATRSLDKEGAFKTLGIQWNPADDLFQYRIDGDADRSRRPTKRAILSRIAQIFDPLGLLGPIIVVAKILIQKLWSLQLEWDESLPSDLHTRWNVYEAQLKELNDLKIPRNVVDASTITRIELHGFCDASQSAYGACVYIRATDENGVHRANLLCSKSRVAPLKATTLPRLELCGAQLLAQLIDKLVAILNLEIHAMYCWTDATIVIDWIKSSSRRFNTFVANRISEIQQLTKIESWRHVGSNDNPADILSRGTDTKALIDAALWWNGPQWLTNEESLWSKTTPSSEEHGEVLEQRKATVVNVALQEEFDIVGRFSKYTKLVKAIAICCRFVHNARSKGEGIKSGPISAGEFETARNRIVKNIQQTSFAKDIGALENQQPVARSSRLLSLNPFLDSEKMLRVGGRLKNSSIPYSSKHPLILPGQHRFTHLVIEHEHERTLHAGPHATLAAVRSRYWPLGARQIVRNVVQKCITCFKARPHESQRIMGDLPSARVTPSRPFSHVGIDYCGPIHIREGKRRNAKKSKAWIAIFVCFATKAVHIELVSDLTSEGFLNALKRFISRRGKPSDIYSDNGTNFVGANRELEELRVFFNQEQVRRRLVNETAKEAITWHFIPPRAPHFGGLWEAAVRSMKHHFNRVASDGSLTFEEAGTLLCQIEAILNSRPLIPLSQDPESCSYLTPGHFLIGDSLISYPEPSLQHLPVSRLSRWQHIEQMRQHFWKRWSTDYLQQMQQRTKWKTNEGSPLQLGQLVIVRESGLPPQSWLMGRVVAVHPGADGVIRTASIKTSRGIFKRPASKLCILPIEI